MVEGTNVANGQHMMFSRRRVLLATAALLSASWSTLAAASRNVLWLQVEYTATSLNGTDGRATPGRLWRSHSALRHEGQRHGRALTVIARLDREQMSRMRERDSATVQSAESQLRQLQTGIRYQKEMTAGENVMVGSQARQRRGFTPAMLRLPSAVAEDREALLREFLSLKNGLPSHDTFSRVFRLLDPAAFGRVFEAFLDEPGAPSY